MTSYDDIRKAFKELIKSKKATSLVSITQNVTSHPIFNVRLNKKKLIQKYKNSRISIHRQKVSKLYYLSGNIYISQINSFLKYKSFVQKNTVGYVVDKWKASEIDDRVDFIKTEALMKYKNLNK